VYREPAESTTAERDCLPIAPLRRSKIPSSGREVILWSPLTQIRFQERSGCVLPGQYITVHLDHPTTPTSPRNYSLSDRPGLDYFRISVKREPAALAEAPEGLISNYLHDTVKVGDRVAVGPPSGEFTIDPANPPKRPIVFIAGGIGATPLLAMAKTLVAAETGVALYFIQAARNSSVHALQEEVRSLADGSPPAVTRVVYDEPLPGDRTAGKCDAFGLITKELLSELTPTADAEYYF